MSNEQQATQPATTDNAVAEYFKTASGYREFVMTRTKDMQGVTNDILHAAVGLSGEAGEALDIAKKMWVYNQTLSDTNKAGVTHYAHLLEEAGDMMFYLQMLCNHLGISFHQLRDHNVDKLLKRYKNGYSDEAAKARADKNGEDS